VLGALLAAAAVLLAVELAGGAAGYGEDATQDACTAHAEYPGSGLDATLQRIVLDGLYGAACELGTTREQLVLSFDPNLSSSEIRWDHATIERAVRSGLVRAIDDAEERASLPGFAAAVLRAVVERAPIEWLLDRAGSLGGLFSG
jgi:hypothetical protein